MRSLKRSRQRGSSLLETALVVPLLLFILAGVVDIGLAYHTYIVMINAAREGARYGINHPWDTSGIRARVLNEAYNSDVDLSEATFYTDSITDLRLLEAVAKPVAVNPDKPLERVARSRGWPVVDWGKNR